MWDDPDATLIGFANTRHPANRTHKTVNSFSLWKNRSPLLPCRGTLAHHFYVGGKVVDNGPAMYKGNQRVMARLGGSGAPHGSRAWGTDVGTPVAAASEAGACDFIRSASTAFAGVPGCERTVVYLHPVGPDKVDHVAILDRFKVEDRSLTPHVVFQPVFEPKVGRDWTGQQQIAAGGYWRFHLVPEAPSAAYFFLTAIEATDSMQARPSGALELLPSEDFLAARLGPNLVLFSRSGAALEGGSVRTSSEGLRRIVVADLQPQTQYQVKLAGKEVGSAKMTSAGTLLIKKADWPAGELLEVRRQGGESPR